MDGEDAMTSGVASEEASSGENEVKKIVRSKDQNKLIKVKNISKGNICLSTGTLEPGDTGKATVAEARQLHKFLESL